MSSKDVAAGVDNVYFIDMQTYAKRVNPAISRDYHKYRSPENQAYQICIVESNDLKRIFVEESDAEVRDASVTISVPLIPPISTRTKKCDSRSPRSCASDTSISDIIE